MMSSAEAPAGVTRLDSRPFEAGTRKCHNAPAVAVTKCCVHVLIVSLLVVVDSRVTGLGTPNFRKLQKLVAPWSKSVARKTGY